MTGIRIAALLSVFLSFSLPWSGIAQSVIEEETPDDGAADPPTDSADSSGEEGVSPVEDEAAPEPAAVTRPPELVEFVQAEYPAEAQEAGQEASVELEITIGVDGRVTEARVVGSAGEAFDQAAMVAVQRFVFRPAVVEGQEVASVIRYRYRFELRVEPEPEPEEPPPGRISGRLLISGEESPIEEAEIILVQVEGEITRRAVTGADGRFAFEGLPAGSYSVRVLGDVFGDMDATEEVAAGEETAVIYRLQAPQESEDLTFGAVAEVEAPPREVTRRTIPRAALTRIPGTRGDALRTVEILPGVNRPPFGAGAILVRGSAPRDSVVLLEGTQVPLLYHFGGLTSFINSRLLERIDFFPGNFSSRYGRVSGGVLEVSTRDPSDEGFAGVVETSLIDASFLVEGPITEGLSVAAAGRRSLIDAAIEAFVPEGAINFLAAPVYYDYQLLATYRPGDQDKIRLLAYGAWDTLRLLFADDISDDPTIRGDLDVLTQFHYGQLVWERDWNADLQTEVSVQAGPSRTRFGLGDLFLFNGDFNTVSIRSEARLRLSPWLRMIGGMDIQVIPFDLSVRGPQAQQTEGRGQNEPFSSSDTIDISRTGSVYRPAAYVEAEVEPMDDLRFVAGFRADWYREIQSWSFDPRFSGFWQISDDTRLRGGVGLFSQPPFFSESTVGVGNPDLSPNRSMHVGLGVDHEFAEGVTASVEGFYKDLWDRVVSTEDGSDPFFNNDGVGRIYGLELSAQISPVGRRFFGYLSYTLSRSERRDHPGEPWRLFDFDQTHILNLAGVYRLPRGWEVGATVRLVSGNPTTPVAGTIYDANNDVYIPISGPINSDRSPLFHRLDVRVEKKWTFDDWRLALFLDVQNAYNASNREGVAYNYNYSESMDISGLPIIPAIGIRGEM